MTIEVSDHALVRFLERTGATELGPLKRAIAASLERAELAAARAGLSEYTVVVDGLRYLVRDGVLVSVLDGRMRLGPR